MAAGFTDITTDAGQCLQAAASWDMNSQDMVRWRASMVEEADSAVARDSMAEADFTVEGGVKRIQSSLEVATAGKTASRFRFATLSCLRKTHRA
jgi:hypothetical protein